MLGLLLDFWRISVKGQYRNAFLAYSFRSRKQVQKYEEYFIRQKKYSHMSGKRCIFAAFFEILRSIE